MPHDEAPKTKYRVCWQEPKQDWQQREFGADQQAARRFHRQQRNALRPAIVQWWSEGEQKWIG